MNWKFWVKKAEPRKVYIPEGKKRQLLAAYVKLKSAPRNCNALVRYDFWKMAEDVCPETTEGRWVTKMENGTEPYFLEILDH